MVNSIAKLALKSYLNMTNPGYAMLVDAPWGAGKTYFVKEVCSEGANQNDVRYVSLNGVSDDLTFRRALLKDSYEASLAKRSATIADILSRRLNLGDLGSLARDYWEERLISSLPQTLVFDDLERCSIDPQTLFGLINEFVEHKNKRVVLLTHSKEQSLGKDFRLHKEKLVGRTLQIKADLDSALPVFISTMMESRGKKYFEDHSEIVRSVFGQAGHQNLRLLRNALQDCSLVLDRIEEKLFFAKEPMARFVKTHLALSMALAKGEIQPEDLERRDNWRVAANDEAEEVFKGLNELFKRHQGCDIYAHSGSVLSKALCELMFVQGFVETEVLNDLLRSTGQFAPQDENPLWRRVVHWSNSGWDELERLVDQAEHYLFQESPVEAGPYLHIAHSLLWIESLGGLKVSRQQLLEKVLKRVVALEESGGLPVAAMGRQFGWAKDERHFYFGGYGCEADDTFLEIMKAMSETQLRVYEKQKPRIASDLANCFHNDLQEFLSYISYAENERNLYYVPIIHEIDVDEFSGSCVEHFKAGQSKALGQIFEKLAERHKNSGDWQSEIEWFCLLRKRLEEAAKNHSDLVRAQLAVFFRFHWKFASPKEREAE